MLPRSGNEKFRESYMHHSIKAGNCTTFFDFAFWGIEPIALHLSSFAEGTGVASSSARSFLILKPLTIKPAFSDTSLWLLFVHLDSPLAFYLSSIYEYTAPHIAYIPASINMTLAYILSLDARKITHAVNKNNCLNLILFIYTLHLS